MGLIVISAIKEHFESNTNSPGQNSGKDVK